MKTHVEFKSDSFPAYDGEDKLINPGRWGKRLAEFIAAGLPSRGFTPKAPLAEEDWGWVLAVENEAFPLWIGIGNYEEHPNGFLCFIEPPEPAIRRFLFKKIDTRERIEALQRAMDDILTGEKISDKRWYTFEEFNSGVR